MDTLARVGSGGGAFDLIYRMRAGDGSWRWFRDIGHATIGERGIVTRLQGLMVEATPIEQPSPEDRFRSVVEHLSAIVYLEELPAAEGAGRMLYVSPQVHELLGFTQDEWLGDPTAWARQLHPEDRDRVRAIYERIETTGEPFRAEYRMYARDGSVRWLRDEALVVRDGAGAPLYWQGVMFDVTEQHESAERADASEERYRTLVEQIPVIVYREAVVGDEMQVVYINSRVESLLGITPAEWIEDSAVWMAAIHPDDRERVEAENRRTEETGEPFVIEYRMVARDGRTVWFRDEAALQRTETGAPAHWQGVMMDITARKEAEAGLAEAEARYRALVEQLPAIAYIDPIDRHGTVYISPQTEAILGYEPAEWYANPDLWRSIVHPEDLEGLETTSETDPYSSTYRVVSKDGREVWIHDQARPIYDDDGNLVYWQGLLLDVTDQRRTQELERALDLERLEAERLRAEDEMKTTFLHAVSHDLRTPLGRDPRVGRHARARGPHAVARRVTRPRAPDRAERATTGSDGQRLPRSRAAESRGGRAELDARRRGRADPRDRGRLGPRHRPAPRARRRADHRARRSGHDRADRREPPRQHGEAHAGRRADLGASDPPGRWHRARGRGRRPGRPDADKVRIFESFRQGIDAASGSGVGLALVARFAELHDGRAWVEDRPGGGASFHVTIAAEPTERHIDLTTLEDQTETDSSADSQA